MRRALAGLAAAAMITGCGYKITYDQAYVPEPIHMARWDPPDSMVFAMPEPPPVFAVEQDAALYFLLNPPVRDEPKPRRRSTPPAEPAVAAVAVVLDSAAVDPEAVMVDSMAVQDTIPAPAVRVDLSHRLERAYERRARTDLAVAKDLARVLGERELTDRGHEQLQAAQGFLERAQEALDRSDFEGASNLALKARTLTESLIESHP